MKISYLITTNTESDTLKKLIEKIYNHLGNDELIILQDESNWNIKRKKYLCDITELNNSTSEIISLPIFIHLLNNNYSNHKNFGIEKCTGDWICQLDADELPTENIIGENLHKIIESNPEVELIFIPRINDYRGVTPEIAKQWNWSLTNSNSNGIACGRPLVNWNSGDYQGRIFKRDYPRIHWEGKLHERIVGHNLYAFLPKEEEYALYHDKSIERQLETNRRYNNEFTLQENMGHKIV